MQKITELAGIDSGLIEAAASDLKSELDQVR